MVRCTDMSTQENQIGLGKIPEEGLLALGVTSGLKVSTSSIAYVKSVTK